MTLGSNSAQAQCAVAANTVTCANTTTTDTTNTDGATASSSDRHQLFTTGGNVTGTVGAGVTVDGFGLALSTTEAGATVTVSNDGAIQIDVGNAPTAGGTAAHNISANGGLITYSGTGTVTNNGTGDGLGATNTGTGGITLTAGGDISSTTGAGVSLTTGSGNISFTNNATVSGGTSAVAGSTTGTFDITNNTTITGGVSVAASGTSLFTNNGTWTTGAVTSTYSGSLTNSGTVTVTAGGDVTISGGVTNQLGGIIVNNGTLTDDLNNAGTVTNNATMNAIVATNTGTITNNSPGIWTGAVLSNTTGTINNNTGATWIGNANNDGGTLNNDGTWTGTVANAGTFNNTANGTVSGLVTNTAGTTTNAGTLSNGITITGGTFTQTGGLVSNGLINSAIVNANGGAIHSAIANNAGSFNVGGTVTSDSTFGNANGATLAIGAAGNYTVAGLITNSGAITVASGGVLTATSGITVTATGTIVNDGTLTDDLNNAGTVDNNATMNAIVATNTGTINNNAPGIWTGAVLSNTTGTITNNAGATWSGDANNDGGTLNNAGTWTGNATNAGTLGNTGTWTGTASNSGTLTNSAIWNGALIANTGIVTNNVGATWTGAATNNFGGTLNNTGTWTGTASNSGTLTNSAIWNGALIANTSIVTNNVGATWTGNATNNVGGTLTNAGTWIGNGIASGSLTNSGTWSGTMTNSGTFTNTAAGTVLGRVTNTAGTTGNAGVSNGGLTNSGGTTNNSGTINSGATVTGGTLNTTGVINGGLTNSATVNAAGTISGAVLNQGSGTFTVTGALAGNSTFTNNGTARLNVTGGNYTGLTTLTNNSTAAVGVNVAAGKTLSVVNIVNANGSTIVDAGLISLTGTVNNAGFIHVMSGGFLSAPTTGTSIVNTSTGKITVDAGGRIKDDLANAGLVTNNGIFDASVASNTGTIINAGIWTTQNATGFNTSGTLTTTGTLNATLGGLKNTGTVNAQGTILGAINNNAGTFTVTGSLVGNNVFTNANSATLAVDNKSFTGLTAVNNNAGGLVTIAGGTLGATTINNAGLINASGGASTFTTSLLTNTGTINLLGPSTAITTGGNLSNSGTINMQNSITGNVTNVGGSYSGNGVIKVDVNFANHTGDILNAQTATSGTTRVDFRFLGNGFLATPLVIVHTAGTNATAFTSAPIPDFGFISYQFVQQGNDWVIRSTVNGNFGALASISGAVSTIANGFHQPASSYVTTKPNPRPNEVLCGTWARADAARMTTSADTSLASAAASFGSFRTKQQLAYEGLQSGLDCGLLNIGASGWHAHLGITGGQIRGEVTQSDGSGKTDVDNPFLGGYVFVTNGAFTFDVAVRREFHTLELTVPAAGLIGRKVDGSANVLALSGSYRAEVVRNLFLQPFIGMNWTVSQLDDFDISFAGVNIGRVSPGEDGSAVGRVGAQLSYVQSLGGSTFLVPFGGVSFWRNFENSTDLKLAVRDFGTGAATIDARTAGPRDFTQFDAGLSLTNTGLGAVGFVKGTFREGADIHGWAVSGGGRINF